MDRYERGHELYFIKDKPETVKMGGRCPGKPFERELGLQIQTAYMRNLNAEVELDLVDGSKGRKLRLLCGNQGRNPQLKEVEGKERKFSPLNNLDGKEFRTCARFE